MLIIHAEGQTCNKFFIYLNFIGACIESGEKIVILSPDITIKDYSNFYHSNIIKFPFYNDRIACCFGYKNYINFLKIIWCNKYILRLLSVLFRWVPGIDFVISSSGSHKSKKHLKYAIELKNIFRPNFDIRSEVDFMFLKIKASYEIICGVHIRRGDYKLWNDGKYYYSIKQYHSFMLNIKKIFPNQTVAFFITSNNDIDLSSFSDCVCFDITNKNPAKDLYGLSCCNYIIGPPSTFSGWASYYGNTPLCFIENPDEEMTQSSFKHILEIWG